MAAIRAVREQEMRFSGRMSHIRAANMTLQFISVPLFAFVTFTVVRYVKLLNGISSSVLGQHRHVQILRNRHP